MSRERALVIKFGGSEATGMEGARTGYLYDFLSNLGSDFLRSYEHIGLVIGGGPRVRALQATVEGNTAKNLIAREAMWEHAESLRQVAQSMGLSAVATIPHSPEEMNHILTRDKSQVMVMSWLRDGQSSDASSVLLAEKWMREIREAEIVILSNIPYIFTADPNRVSDARPITKSNIRTLVREGVLSDDPTTFLPGDHVVIDAVAVSILSQGNNGEMPLYFGHGGSSFNVARFLRGQSVSEGTVLHDSYRTTEYLR